MPTEYEKMIAGEFYKPSDLELRALAASSREKQWAFNAETNRLKRAEIVKSWFGSTGENVAMNPQFVTDYGVNIHIGENFYSNWNLTMLDICPITIGDNESAKYWLSVLNELKNRGVKDILIICADGLTGIKEAIAAAFPKTEYQRCIVHQVRNTLKYVPDKDRKAFATDLKTIYQAADEQKALAALDRVTEKWTPKYPNSMKRWKDNWDAVSPIFKFSTTVRKVIYTTNAIESLNSTYRKLNRQRSVFPSDTALLKALYLATFEATKKWTTTIRDWAQVYGELSIMYEGRLPE